VAGLVVAVRPPPVATTPVNDGSEKYVFSRTPLGHSRSLDASLVKVTVNVPLAATVSGFVKRVDATQYCRGVVPNHVARAGQETPELGDGSSAETCSRRVVVFVGRLTPVIVTG